MQHESLCVSSKHLCPINQTTNKITVKSPCDEQGMKLSETKEHVKVALKHDFTILFD